jgi:hypothetical protein
MQRAVVEALATSLCNDLRANPSGLSASTKTAVISAYKTGVNALVQSGWLTGSQATTLKALASAL